MQKTHLPQQQHDCLSIQEDYWSLILFLKSKTPQFEQYSIGMHAGATGHIEE
jgi:hypothetical protein